MGLKFGVYTDTGIYTCGGDPGLDGHYTAVAEQMAHEWNIDYLKMDGCYDGGSKATYKHRYTAISEALTATGRPIVFSCSWPTYITNQTEKDEVFPYIKDICHLWRLYVDIYPADANIYEIKNYWAEHSNVLVPVAGPGHWNDPDMLVIGNDLCPIGNPKDHVSINASRVQFSIWAIVAAPMILGDDLRNLTDAHLALMRNTKVIAVSQDRLGEQGYRIFRNDDHDGNWELWRRNLTDGARAIAFVNQRAGEPRSVHATIGQIGFPELQGQNLTVACTDLYNDGVVEEVSDEKRLDVIANPNDVRMFTCAVKL